ncbi:MAG: hypothetical protein KJ018_10335 [Burkholderiales bacterium]|nr:hypothetical protein [Burkholderiales bacterium]GIK84689.1 MAG: hypothetical protein BroJett026_01700 [Betaproteobacteria bacterium]
MPRRLPLAAPLLAAALALAPAAGAQSYLPKARPVGGNPGPAHNYVCPNVDASGSALDCFLDAARHLYTMCRHVKSIEIIEHGYENSEAGTNSAKSESCVQKQTANIARPYGAALREARVSRQAADGVKSLYEYWTASLAALKWQAGESDDDYRQRTAGVLGDLEARAAGIRQILVIVREHTTPPATGVRGKAAR